METWNTDYLNNTSHFSMAIISPRRKGKSTFIKHLISVHGKKYDEIIIISNSILNSDSDYSDINCIKVSEFDPTIIKALIELQQEDDSNNVLIIFDDCISNKMKYCNEILQIFSRGRHLKISIIFATQSHTLIDSNWRENLDYFVTFGLNTKTKMETIVDGMLSGLRNGDEDKKDKQIYSEWAKIFKEHCQNYGCIIVDYVNSKVYSYRVPGKSKIIKIKKK